MSRRSEAERKSREIEEDLRRQSEIGQDRVEAVINTAKLAARFEEERKSRIASEQAKAEAEASVREMEAKVAKADESLRRIEEKYKLEIDWIRAELEEMAAAARQADDNHKAEEEKYKVEIDWIRAKMEEMAATARQADDNHKAEMAGIIAQAESRAHQAEMNLRQQYQIKVEEALASAQAAIFNLDETQKKLSETEAKYREMEYRARQAETRSRRLYLILKLSFSSAEQIIAETPGLGDEYENDATIIPIDLPTNTYSDDFSSETPETAANGSMDYEDILFSDRMKALLEAAARAKAPDD
jgi:hypothetical protein